jgi:hypothetical protein
VHTCISRKDESKISGIASLSEPPHVSRFANCKAQKQNDDRDRHWLVIKPRDLVGISLQLSVPQDKNREQTMTVRQKRQRSTNKY